MKYRELGRTGFKVSEVSFGAWAIGGTWGTVIDDESMAALHRAVDSGINFSTRRMSMVTGIVKNCWPD